LSKFAAAGATAPFVAGNEIGAGQIRSGAAEYAHAATAAVRHDGGCERL
jgi:hypothetical protein